MSSPEQLMLLAVIVLILYFIWYNTR
ncbi:uncharacterized protein METZ01_LOCUS457915 [marine metagenome]|uniref:Uncharacterized protein n=1 Tax=marine metagenome TaxID=408172 RepID=A0A383ABP6_9ZZZZ